jgi:hypothetical protein
MNATLFKVSALRGGNSHCQLPLNVGVVVATVTRAKRDVSLFASGFVPSSHT